MEVTVTIERIAVLGLGPVGALAAELVVESGFETTGVDQRAPADAASTYQAAGGTFAAHAD